MGTSLFKLTMHANNKQALEPPLIAFWSNLGFHAFLNQQPLEYFNLVEISIVIVLGSVEDFGLFFNYFS
jgi:hypothetical protein